MFKRKEKATILQVGLLLDEGIRSSTFDGGSPPRFFADLGIAQNAVTDVMIVEYQIGLVFANAQAIHAAYRKPLAGKLEGALNAAFLTCARADGMSDSALREFRIHLLNRLLAYSSAASDLSGGGPGFNLGKSFLWNVLGQQVRSGVGVMAAATVLFAHRESPKEIVENIQVVE